MTRDADSRRIDHEDESDGDDREPAPSTVSYAVVTTASSRTIEEDDAGDAVVRTVEAVGDEVTHRELVLDDYDGVQSTVNRVVDRADVDAVVTVGGTGVMPDDVTVEAVRPLFDKELPGFGELFRALSRDSIGTATVATRTTAGVVDRTPVFCLPGNEDAARLGTEEIVVSETAHIAGLAPR